MSLNIYNPTTQQLTEVAGLDVKDSLEKVATLPTPTADYLNQVYILVGTQEGYHVGSIYQCRYINSAYTWVEITGSVVGKADKAPNATNNHLAKLTADGNLADSGIAVGDLGTAINKNWTDLVRPNSHDLVESNAVYSAITNAISSIYTPHGDITCAELVPALLIDENIGNVYTVTDSGTTTAYFIQGAGKTINVGDSVSVIKAGADTILFNLMGNVLDLTDYQKKNLTTAIEIGGTTQTTVEGALGGLNTKETDDIEGIWKANSVFGVKNLIPFPSYTHTLGNPVIYSGVTYTQNADESVALDGIPTNSSVYHLLHRSYEESHIFEDSGAGNYILTCDVSDENIIFTCYFGYLDGEGNTTWINPPHTNNKGSIVYTFTVTEAMSHYGWSLQIGSLTAQSTGYDNFTVRTMIRLASDTDDTYQPYAKTNRQLTKDKAEQAEVNDIVNVLGAKNLLPNNAVSQTINGVTFTVNADKSVTVNGTATATVQFELNPSVYVGAGNKIIISGCPSGDSEYIRLRLTEENSPTYVVDDAGDGVTYNPTADKYGCRIIIFNGYTANNLTFKPMIRLASDPDDTYIPYAMTNQEITRGLDDKVGSYTDNVSHKINQAVYNTEFKGMIFHDEVSNVWRHPYDIVPLTQADFALTNISSKINIREWLATKCGRVVTLSMVYDITTTTFADGELMFTLGNYIPSGAPCRAIAINGTHILDGLSLNLDGSLRAWGTLTQGAFYTVTFTYIY